MTTSVISLVLKFVPLARILLAKPTNMNLEILNFSKHCRGPLRTLRISLVWISNMVVSQYEEKAMSLLVFNPSLRHSMSSFHLSYVAVSGPFHSLEFYPKRASL